MLPLRILTGIQYLYSTTILFQHHIQVLSDEESTCRRHESHESDVEWKSRVRVGAMLSMVRLARDYFCALCTSTRRLDVENHTRCQRDVFLAVELSLLALCCCQKHRRYGLGIGPMRATSWTGMLSLRALLVSHASVHRGCIPHQ